MRAPESPLISGTHYDIGASGYAAQFNRVALFVSVGRPCATTALAEARTGTPEHLFVVPRERGFAVATRHVYRAKAPGARYACAYLFAHKRAASDQLRAQEQFDVVAKR